MGAIQPSVRLHDDTDHGFDLGCERSCCVYGTDERCGAPASLPFSVRQSAFKRWTSAAPSNTSGKIVLLCHNGSSKSTHWRQRSPSGVPGIGENSESMSRSPRPWAKCIEASMSCCAVCGCAMIKYAVI